MGWAETARDRFQLSWVPMTKRQSCINGVSTSMSKWSDGLRRDSDCKQTTPFYPIRHLEHGPHLETTQSKTWGKTGKLPGFWSETCHHTEAVRALEISVMLHLLTASSSPYSSCLCHWSNLRFSITACLPSPRVSQRNLLVIGADAALGKQKAGY